MVNVYRILLFLLLFVGAANAQPIPSTASPGGGGLSLNGPNTPGRFYFPMIAQVTTNGALGAANRLYASPIFVGPGSILKSLSFDIGTGNAAAWNARMCVYADNGSGLPGSLIPNGDTGTIAIGSGSVTGVQTATLNGSTGIPVSGWIWVAFVADSASESLFSYGGSLNVVTTLMSNMLGVASAAAVFNGTSTAGVFTALTFGACPGTFGAASYSNAAGIPFIAAGF